MMTTGWKWAEESSLTPLCHLGNGYCCQECVSAGCSEEHICHLGQFIRVDLDYGWETLNIDNRANFTCCSHSRGRIKICNSNWTDLLFRLFGRFNKSVGNRHDMNSYSETLLQSSACVVEGFAPLGQHKRSALIAGAVFRWAHFNEHVSMCKSTCCSEHSVETECTGSVRWVGWTRFSSLIRMAEIVYVNAWISFCKGQPFSLPNENEPRLTPGFKPRKKPKVLITNLLSKARGAADRRVERWPRWLPVRSRSPERWRATPLLSWHPSSWCPRRFPTRRSSTPRFVSLRTPFLAPGSSWAELLLRLSDAAAADKLLPANFTASSSDAMVISASRCWALHYRDHRDSIIYMDRTFHY